MERGGDTSLEGLKTISSIVDEFGYESILLVYHSKIEDNWIKAARVLDTNHKFKYMPAIRTYAISPEYCAMISKAFYNICPNRLMLNIVSGDLHEEETSVQDIIWFGKDLDTPEKRLKYTDDWILKFNSLADNTVSEIVMGGHSNETRFMAEKYNATHLAMLNMHKQSYQDPNVIKNTKQMLSFSIIINDSESDIKNMLSRSLGSERWTIHGNKDSVKEQIKNLKDLGATDLLVSPHPEDSNVSSIHYLIKEIMGEQNGIK
jgi:alkanesulfonate monooxygenase SsuD/methylene tetrahydromethanopterin reductase-like flavin-dependent oxidoreductase (luciferase family)